MIGSTIGLSLLLAGLIAAALAALGYLRNQNRERNLIRRASYDEVTGLCDFSTGEKLVRHALSNLHQGKLALALLDIDDMTRLRDRCGEAACNELLRTAAQRLLGCLTDRDHLCHVMNDTLLVAFPFEGEDCDALARVEAMRAQFGADVACSDGEPLTAHASAGASISPTNGRQYAELYEKADMALFWAKRDGKDRAMLYREPDA